MQPTSVLVSIPDVTSELYRAELLTVAMGAKYPN